jgi:hypothetical protein
VGRSLAACHRTWLLAELACSHAVRSTVNWRELETRTELRFRDQNEWIDGMSRSFGCDGLTAFVCECGDGDCTEPIEMTKPEYEWVRADSTCFALSLNHENPETDHVVAEFVRYAVVKKVDVVAARLARQNDPRRAPDGLEGHRQ